MIRFTLRNAFKRGILSYATVPALASSAEWISARSLSWKAGCLASSRRPNERAFAYEYVCKDNPARYESHPTVVSCPASNMNPSCATTSSALSLSEISGSTAGLVSYIRELERKECSQRRLKRSLFISSPRLTAFNLSSTVSCPTLLASCFDLRMTLKAVVGR